MEIDDHRTVATYEWDQDADIMGRELHTSEMNEEMTRTTRYDLRGALAEVALPLLFGGHQLGGTLSGTPRTGPERCGGPGSEGQPALALIAKNAAFRADLIIELRTIWSSAA